MPPDRTIAARQLVELLAACEEVVELASTAIPTLVAECTSAPIGRCLLETLVLSAACTAIIDLGIVDAGYLPFITRITVNDCRTSSQSCATACEAALGAIDVILDLAIAARRCESACLAVRAQ